MEIVIDISEDLYTYMQSRYKYQNKDDEGLSKFGKAGVAIKNGIVLPKGHGKIIDVNNLLDRIGLEDNESNREDNVGEIITLEDFDYIPTIIPADTSESEEEVIKVKDCSKNIGDYDIPIHNAIIIPENATNGDMVKAMFPNEPLTSITGTLWLGDNMSFNRNWWNAPYKTESEADNDTW